MLAWGCNAKVTVPPRFKNNGKAKLTYKHATAMEVLVRLFTPCCVGLSRDEMRHMAVHSVLVPSHGVSSQCRLSSTY